MTTPESPTRASLLPVALLLIVGIAVVAGGAWAVRGLLLAPSGSHALQRGAGQTAKPQTIEEILAAARVYMDQDQPGSAEVILAEAVRTFPASQSLRLLLGECLLQQERLPEAYEAYTQGIFIGPDHPEYRFVAGTLASRIGRDEDAITHYRRAQSLDPSNPKHPLYLAQVQRRVGQTDEARANLIIATRLDENLAVAWGALAAIALDENRLEVARGYIERARTIEPASPAYRVIESKILRRGNEPRRAADLLLELSADERLRDAGVVYELGLCHAMLGETREAAALYVSAVSLHPDDAEMLFQAAQALQRDGQGPRAETFAHAAAQRGHEGARRLLESLER